MQKGENCLLLFICFDFSTSKQINKKVSKYYCLYKYYIAKKNSDFKYLKHEIS